MARLSPTEQFRDLIDRATVGITGNLDTQLRIAQRAAKLRELNRLERLEQQYQAQANLPMALPEQARPGTAVDPPPRRRKRSHGPAQKTLWWFGAALAYFDSGGAYEANMSPGELGRRIAQFAVDHDLDGAKELLDVADDSTPRDLMTAGLAAIRRARGR
jgi:hypothetical protein